MLLAVGGAGAREAYRQLLTSGIEPLGRIVEAELSEKLERPITLSFRRLAAADIVGRARALKGLVGAGVPLVEGRELV